MRQRLTAICATTGLVLTLAGCTDDGGAAPPPVSRPTVLAELDDDPGATTALSQALDALGDGNSGTFTTHLDYADLTFDYNGSYRLSPAQQRVTVAVSLADGPVETEVVGDAGRFYVRLPPDGPVSSPCWVSGDPQRIAEATGVETNPDFNRLPGAISLASTATGVAYSETGDVLGSVDLATATALISPRLPALLRIEGAPHRVLARFSVDDGVLSGISVGGPAILAALKESGTKADPEELADVFAADVAIDVVLADPGAEIAIRPPSPAAVIDLGAPDAQDRLDACR